MDRKTNLKLVNPELKARNSFASPTLSFDDLGDFIEEREKIKRLLESKTKTELRIDYSDFSNHVFFDSAVSKFEIAKKKILNDYPYNGSTEEKDAFHLTGSGYEKYVFDQWPRHVGYIELDGIDQYISASDVNNSLLLGSSSLQVSAWVNPIINGMNPVLIDTVKYQNLLSASENFDTDNWVKYNTTASLDAGILDPFGNTDSVSLVANSVSSEHFVSQARQLTVGAEYLFSVYAKPGNKPWIHMDVVGIAGAEAYFDLISGVVGSAGPFDEIYIESVGNGWYRCSGLFLAAGTGLHDYNVGPATGDSDRTFVGDNSTVNTYILGAQLSEVLSSNEISINYVKTPLTGYLDNKIGYELYFSGAADSYLKFDFFSGSEKISLSCSYSSFTSSFNSVGAIYDGQVASLFVNNQCKNSALISYGPIEKIPNKIFIGSGSTLYHASSSFDMYSGSIDNVMVLHTASSLFYSKNYSRPIDSNSYVSLYYKFNEGVTDVDSVDSLVIDYSKNGIHGKIVNYNSSTSRVSGAAYTADPGDPILYNFHPDVLQFSASLVLSASLYDTNNNNYIFNLISIGVIEEDLKQENILTSFSLAMARFFDELKLYIDQFGNLKVTNYDNAGDTPDLFLPNLTKYFGWKITEHFGDANPLEFFFGDGVLASGSLEVPLYEIRNQFWRRILNNLPYLLATKGKRNNLDAFFNVLGINKENINIKEYGYLPGGSVIDERINKEKVTSLMGFGTGSLSSSFIKVPSVQGAVTNGSYTVETTIQLPFASASYAASLLTGAVWQFVDPAGASSSVSLLWNVDTLGSTSGKFMLTSSDGYFFSGSSVPVFNGDIVYLVAGISPTAMPFIEVRTTRNGELDFSSSFIGSSAMTGAFVELLTDEFDFIMGASSGSLFQFPAQGFMGEYRYWNRQLSSSEMNDHALNFLSVGTNNPAETPHPLRAHWPLGENVITDTAGNLNGVLDLSRNGHTATGSMFLGNHNPYKKFLLEYSHLSPSVDLRWTENKIRIRNKTELSIQDLADDTNEVSLEFSLVDALNKDITKIFSTFDVLNEAIGNPVNKYRDEYADLEAYRRIYFERLGDSVHFTAFFELFKWFDRKISDSIKQLLPARVKFVGGEHVVESHFLERPRYGYKYPIFRTPVEIPEAAISASSVISANNMNYFADTNATKGTQVRSAYESDTKHTVDGIFTLPRESSVAIDASIQSRMVSTFADGASKDWRNSKPTDPAHKFTFKALDFNSGSFTPYAVFSSGFYLFVGGTMVSPSSEGHDGQWTIYRSGSGSPWEIVDQGRPYPIVGNVFSSLSNDVLFGYESYLFDAVRAFTLNDSDDTIYACGQLSRSFCVRSSSLGGASGSWGSVDIFMPSSGTSYTSTARSLSIAPSGKLYCAGDGMFLSGAANRSAWVVRSSSLGITGSWGTSDMIFYPGTDGVLCPQERPRNIVCVDENNIVVVGSNFNDQYGIIRTTINGGSSWSTVFTSSLYTLNGAEKEKDSSVLYFYGELVLPSIGVILKSEDSGNTLLDFYQYGTPGVSSIDSAKLIKDYSSGEQYLIFGAHVLDSDQFLAYNIVAGSSLHEIKLSNKDVNLISQNNICNFIPSVNSSEGGEYIYASCVSNYNLALAAILGGEGEGLLGIPSLLASASLNITGTLFQATTPIINTYRPSFYAQKINGSTLIDNKDSQESLNFKNYYTKNILADKDRNNN